MRATLKTRAAPPRALKREVAEDPSDALAPPRRRIRCPACRWEPDGRPHWQCELCFAVFDTFETQASCPACPNRWRETQCPKCGETSDHEDWYAADDEG